ncbi:centrosomal P4.1-associated protein [Pogona vitticeps]
MATSADFNWEENLVAHWMSNASRAGVILNPMFSNLKIPRANSLDNASSTLALNLHHSSRRTSLSEDSLCSEQALGPNKACVEMVNSSKTLFPNSLVKKDLILMPKDVLVPRQQTDVECDKSDLDEEHCTDLLLQKLEQLKGWQQHKQEQLKRQQMDEIQRLMEEQHRLLSMVSEQEAHTGENIESPEKNILEHADGDSGCEGAGNVESSESLTGAKCMDRFNAEERPIPVSIQGGKQSFEEFLEEQIRLEEQRLSQKGNVKDVGIAACQKPVAKRPFLKRGEGLNRYINAKHKVNKQKENEAAVHVDTSEVRNTVKVDKLQLHRKTAPLNKEQVSDNVTCKNNNQNNKTKKGFSARKTTVLRSSLRKGISTSTRQSSNEKKPGELRNSVRSEINGEREMNKENIVALAKFEEKDTKLSGEKTAQPSERTRCLTNSFQNDPDLSLELSFQKKLENWETEKEIEKNELDEFLFLEQAADEISFASNSSLVLRLLDQGQQISTGHRLSSTPVKYRQEQMCMLDITAVDSENQVQDISQEASNVKTRGLVTGSQALEMLKDHKNESDGRRVQAFPTAEFQTFKSAGWDDDTSDESSEVTSEFEEELETTVKLVNDRTEKPSLTTIADNPLFSRQGKQAQGPNQDAIPDSLGEDSSLDQENEINKAATSESMYYPNSVEFDDETPWSDFEENGSQCAQIVYSDGITQAPLPPNGSVESEAIVPDKVIKRKIAMVKKEEVLPKQSVTDSEITAPPTTDLMLKLFPSLRPKQKMDVQPKHDAKPNMAQEESEGDSSRSQLLREKLVELETEIERFRSENASLTKLREEHENALASLRKEMADFEQQKTKELAQIEEIRKEEMRKLQKERKVFEKYAQAARAIPDKKERDEIQALKQQIATLQGDLKRRETKWSTTHMRLTDQIETLTRENMQLREEIKIMERCRLEAWKRNEVSANKKKMDSCSSTKKAELAHSAAVLQKSQTLSSVPQAEKNSKINGKNDSQPEGRPLGKPKPPAVPDEMALDNTAKPSEESSKTFTVNVPGNRLVEPACVLTADSSNNEDVMLEREANHPDGKIEKIFKNGCHLIIFPNGTRKEVSCDGKITTVTFFNGDVKQVLEDQRVIYYYADAKTTHTTYPTGLEVLHFSNGQIEKHFPDGRKEIVFPDQTIKNVFTDGQEVNIFPDGTTVRIQQDGSKVIEFGNGQQEIHTTHFKRRKYPDGTIKTVYADGRQETQYASGRVRIKNKDGDVIMDTLR